MASTSITNRARRWWRLGYGILLFGLAVWAVGYGWNAFLGIGPDYYFHYRQAPLDYFQGNTRLYDDGTTSLPLLPWAVFLIAPTLPLPIVYGQAMVTVITLIGILWLIVSVVGQMSMRVPIYAVLLALMNLFTVDLLVRGNYEGFLALGLAIAWVGYITKRPLLSGLGIAIFVTKPVNMVLPGFFFAVMALRQGVRYSVLTALPTLLLLAVSFPLFGWDWMVRYVTYTTTVESTYTTLSFANEALYLQTALWRTFEFWGLPQQLALGICVAGLGATAAYIATRPTGTPRAFVITLCAALVFGIYVHGNHYVLLAPALAGLIARDWRYSLIWLLTLSPMLRFVLNTFNVAWTDSLYAIALLIAWVSIAARERLTNDNK